MEGTYVIRINPDAYIDEKFEEHGPCFVRRILSNGEPVLKVTPEFKRRFDFIEPAVRAVYEKAAAGELPTEESWKTKLFFSAETIKVPRVLTIASPAQSKKDYN